MTDRNRESTNADREPPSTGGTFSDTYSLSSRLVVRFLADDRGINETCPVCGKALAHEVMFRVLPLGPWVGIDGSEDAVCPECVRQWAPELAVLLNSFYSSEENLDHAV